MNTALKTIHWVCGSHWDREWHRQFEGFRCRLVEMIDRAIECVDGVPGYKSFLLDGQSIILRDYLEARPEMRETVDRLLREEKLFAGPFYVLQDEMVEDGELFVRNLQKGLEIAKRHGSRRFVGYTTDSFGHAAQLPQLLKLAGVNSVVFSRAFMGKQHDNIWASPDGSEVFFAWLPFGNGPGAHKDLLDDSRHIPEDRAEALSMFEKYLARLDPYSKSPSMLIMDAADHMSADPAALKVLQDFNEKYPAGPRIVFSSLPDAMDDLAKSLGSPRVQGEIRSTGLRGDGWLLPGTVSTRMPLKHGLSDLTRRLLAIEKLYTLLPYSSTVQGALERAWDQLLQNIPHDSICGCHVDEVYIENLNRLNTARSIIEYLGEKALRAFKPASSTTGKTPAALVFDPSPEAGDFKPFVLDCPYPFIEDPNRVVLDAKGAEFVISDVEKYPTHNGHLTTYRIKGFCRNRTGVNLFDVGFRTDVERPAQHSTETHPPLLQFVDSGDAGDTYNYSPPAKDEVVASTGAVSSIRTIQLSPGLLQTRVEATLQVPAQLSTDRQSRSNENAHIGIRYSITRDAESGITWIAGSVKNMARDHRLRVVIPTMNEDSHSFAGSPFYIERRPVKLQVDPAQFTERPLTDYPYVDYIRYGGTSVYAQSNGEFEITSRGIEITLCRSVGWLGRPDLTYRPGQAGPFAATPLAQLVEVELPFAFAVAQSLSDPADDYARKAVLCPLVTQCILIDSPLSIRKTLPITVKGAELAALRRVSDSQIELRLVNPRPETATAQLRIQSPFSAIREVDLNHQPVRSDAVGGKAGQAEIKLRPFQIMTLIAS
jgi:alpha-mannosidase